MSLQLLYLSLFCLIGLLIHHSLWFLVAYALRNNGLADIAWASGFVLVGFFSYSFVGDYTIVQTLTVLMILLWGVRLGMHLSHRNIGRPEDKRYAAWRKQWGAFAAVRSFAQVFILQAVLLWIISLPIIVLQSTPATALAQPAIIGGFCVWLFGSC